MINRLWVESLLCHLLVVWHWLSHWTSLAFHLANSKRGKIREPTRLNETPYIKQLAHGEYLIAILSFPPCTPPFSPNSHPTSTCRVSYVQLAFVLVLLGLPVTMTSVWICSPGPWIWHFDLSSWTWSGSSFLPCRFWAQFPSPVSVAQL